MLIGVSLTAHAASTPAGNPSVSVDPERAEPGELVTLRIDGFEARTVTVAICGNEGRRGSADCDMVASTGVVITPGSGPTVAVVPVTEPPMPCPCVVRVTSPTFDEVAVGSIEVVGHEVAELVTSPTSAASLAVAISATRVATGLGERIDAGLGGDVEYEAVVTLTNTGSAPVDDVLLSASFGRTSTDFLGEIPVESPAVLAGGETWQQVVRVTVPPRVVGTVTWKASAASGLQSVEATSTSTQRPTLLILMAALVVALVGSVIVRQRIRRHARSATTPTAATQHDRSSVASPFT